jgi:predicted house-cleaning noncanonical NTP pyrophosphatase (MazG superfamily)
MHIAGFYMEKALEKLAEQILSFDEASLTHLREKYRLRIEHFDGTKEWEKAVIVYCIINAVSMKNTLFNENILRRRRRRKGREKGPTKKHPGLKRIK